jgi:RHS repeat-associated protein
VTQRGYDDFGRLERETDENLAVTNHAYDGLGRKQRVDYPDGGHEFFDYFSLGNPNAQLIRHIFGPDGVDAASTRNATLGQTSLALFDGFGQTYLEGKSAGEGRTILTTRNEQFVGHQRRVIYTRPAFTDDFADSKKVDRIIVYYDRSDRPAVVNRLRADRTTLLEKYDYGVSTLTLTDVNKRSISNHYDDRGLLDAKTDASGTWPYQYDVAHELRSITFPSGDRLAIDYDSWGRRHRMVDPFAGENDYEHDDASNLTRTTDARKKSVNYTFDEINRPKTKSTDAGATVFHYDRSASDFSMGRLASVDDLIGSVTLSYDVAGHRTDETLALADGQTLSSHLRYDFWGRLTSRDHGTGPKLSYEYPDGFPLRLIKLDGKQVVALSDYSPYGFPRARSTPGANSTLSYAPDGFLMDASSTSANGRELQNLHFDHDPIGNLSLITDQRTTTLVDGIDTSQSQSFIYDGINRLKHATGTYGTVDYDFDSLGNLIQKGDLALTKTGSTWNAMRAGATTDSWTLDDAGDVVAKAEGTDQWGYEYDAGRRLSSVRHNGQLVADFSYDSAGSRVRKTRHAPDGSTTTTYYLDAYELRTSNASTTLSETIHIAAPRVGALGSITTNTLPGQSTGLDVAKAAAGPLNGSSEIGPPEGTWWYVSNYVGSPSVVTDSAGAVVARYNYQPFGELQRANSVGFDSTTFKFGGHTSDDETRLVYFGARYYDPAFGRFTSCDDGVPGDTADLRGLNRQAYALNNPVAFVDADGHFPWAVVLIAGAGAIGVGVYEYLATQDLKSSARDTVGVFAGAVVVAGMLSYAGPAAVAMTAKGLLTASLAGVEADLISKFVSGRPVTADSLATSVSVSMIFFGAAQLAAPGLFRATTSSPSGPDGPPVTAPPPSSSSVAEPPTGGEPPAPTDTTYGPYVHHINIDYTTSPIEATRILKSSHQGAAGVAGDSVRAYPQDPALIDSNVLKRPALVFRTMIAPTGYANSFGRTVAYWEVPELNILLDEIIYPAAQPASPGE